MENDSNNVNLEADVKKSLMRFYRKHKTECEKLYVEATSKEKLDIYEELENIHLLNQFFIKTDIVILTANVFEKNILHLKAVGKKEQKISHFVVNSLNNPRRPLNINIYFFDMGDFHILHMEARQTGSYSMGGSADLIRYILNHDYCYPSAVISYGICFGNDYLSQEIGDTIIAKKLYPYFMSAKVKEKSFFVEDSNIFDIDPQTETRILHLRGMGKLSEDDHIFYGNMVTGEAVISNAVMKEIFIEAATNQPVLGGEMEGYGLFKECQGFECQIPCLLIKAICDWGVYKNFDDASTISINLKDKLQAYAAEQACKALMVLLKKDSKIYKSSIYEQMKYIISTLQMQEETIYPLSLIKSILEDKVKTPKKYKDIATICDMILNGLLQEKLLKRIGENVYKIQ